MKLNGAGLLFFFISSTQSARHKSLFFFFVTKTKAKSLSRLCVFFKKKNLGHTFIDILKIDIEGGEFDALTAFLDQRARDGLELAPHRPTSDRDSRARGPRAL
jgi:hypothetical protein